MPSSNGPFQVSSRLYPGPKAPPKLTRQGGPKTQKPTTGSTAQPPRRTKRVSRQSPSNTEIVAISNDISDHRPSKLVATSNDSSNHGVGGPDVCSQCVLERGEAERWKKAWQEEKVSKVLGFPAKKLH